MNNQELKEQLDLINKDIAIAEERNKLKKQISKAKEERFLLKFGIKLKKKEE